MSNFVIRIGGQHNGSLAKKVLPIAIVCCSLGNHIHMGGISLSIISIGIYLFMLMIDIATRRIDRSIGVMSSSSGYRLKKAVYLWIIYGIIQTIFICLLQSNSTILKELLSCILNLVLMLSIIRFTDSTEDLKHYAFLIIMCTLGELVICHYEMATGNHIRATTFRHYNMVFGTYYNENDLSVMLALGCLTVIYYGTYIKKHKIIKRSILGLLLIDSLYIIIYTRSRGGLYGFGVTVGLILISIIFGRRYDLYKTTYRGIAIIAVVFVVLVIFGLATGQIAITDENDASRMAIYLNALQKIASKPISLLFGFGAGQLRANVGYALHNYVIQTLGDFGIIGCLCYLYIIVGMLKWPNIYQSSIVDSIRKTCVITCALLTIFFGFVVSDFGTIKLSWIMLGLYYADTLSAYKASQRQEEGQL